MPTNLPVFLITTWLLAMLPGAGQALMIRQTLEGGPRLARATIAGNATGLLLWSTAAAAGLSAVLLADPEAYTVVRVAGGSVLVVLGIATLRTALRPPVRTRHIRGAGKGTGGARTARDSAPTSAIPRPECSRSPCSRSS